VYEAQKWSISVGISLARKQRISGKQLRGTTVLGTLEQYSTEDLALSEVTGLRVNINEPAIANVDYPFALEI